MLDEYTMLLGMFKMWEAAPYFGLTPQEFIDTAIRGQQYAAIHPQFWEQPQYGGL